MRRAAGAPTESASLLRSGDVVRPPVVGDQRVARLRPRKPAPGRGSPRPRQSARCGGGWSPRCRGYPPARSPNIEAVERHVEITEHVVERKRDDEIEDYRACYPRRHPDPYFGDRVIEEEHEPGHVMGYLARRAQGLSTKTVQNHLDVPAWRSPSPSGAVGVRELVTAVVCAGDGRLQRRTASRSLRSSTGGGARRAGRHAGRRRGHNDGGDDFGLRHEPGVVVQRRRRAATVVSVADPARSSPRRADSPKLFEGRSVPMADRAATSSKSGTSSGRVRHEDDLKRHPQTGRARCLEGAQAIRRGAGPGAGARSPSRPRHTFDALASPGAAVSHPGVDGALRPRRRTTATTHRIPRVSARVERIG